MKVRNREDSLPEGTECTKGECSDSRVQIDTVLVEGIDAQKAEFFVGVSISCQERVRDLFDCDITRRCRLEVICQYIIGNEANNRVN